MTELGRYVVIEGTDGTGKTTVANLLAHRLREDGRKVIRVDEPGSPISEDGEILVPIAAELRKIIINKELGRSVLTNVYLLTMSRRESWLQAMKPALDEGTDVISTRNYWSTIAYQEYGEGYKTDDIEKLTAELMGFANKTYQFPRNGFILDLDDEIERKRRITNRGENLDRFESKDDEFQERVRKGYRSIARYKRVPLIKVDGKTPDQVTDIIQQKIVD